MSSVIKFDPSSFYRRVSEGRISKEELAEYFTFSGADIREIKNVRGDHNRIAFALHLVAYRVSGAPPERFDRVSQPVLAYIAKQLHIKLTFEKLKYAARKRNQTRYDHAKRARKYLGFKTFTPAHKRELLETLVSVAMVTDSPGQLNQIAYLKLFEDKVERPKSYAIDRLSGRARVIATETIRRVIDEQLTDEQRGSFVLLLTEKVGKRETLFNNLKEPPAKPGMKNLQKLSDRLAQIEAVGVEDLDLSKVPKNRIKILSGICLRDNAADMLKRPPLERNAMLVCLLKRIAADTRDFLATMFEILASRALKRAKEELKEVAAKNEAILAELAARYGLVAETILDKKVVEERLREEIWKKVPKFQVVKDLQTIRDMGNLEQSSGMKLFIRQYGSVMRFFPKFLSSVTLRSQRVDDPLLVAAEAIRDGLLKGMRDLPPDYKYDFLEDEYKDAIPNFEGSDRRRLYELGVMVGVLKGLQSGDIYIKGASRYADFHDHLIPASEWLENRTQYYKDLSLPEDPRAYLQKLNEQMKKSIEKVAAALKQENGVSIVDGRFSVAPLEAISDSQKVLDLRGEIHDRMPQIDISDLLIQIDKITGFREDFRKLPDLILKAHKLPAFFATIVDRGCNVGPSKMSQCSGLSLQELSRMWKDFFMEDTLKAALARLVNAHHRFPLTSVWGSGDSAAADALRFGLRGSSLLGSKSTPFFGFRKDGVGMYFFVSDQYQPFYIDVVPLRTREATYALDGLLGHESDLDPYELFTDTAGYTEIVFALFQMLGLRFAPRLRDIADAQLYHLDEKMVFEGFGRISSKSLNLELIFRHWDEIVRIIASINDLTVTPSLILKRMGSYSRNNSLVLAFQELGRLVKTIFILDYVSDPDLRRRILVGINKLDQVHLAGRAVHYGRQGEIRVPGYHEQLYRASCLNIILMCILLWNTLQIDRLRPQLEKDGFSVTDEVLSHISPMMFEHINFYGKFKFDIKKAAESAMKYFAKVFATGI